MKDPNGTWHYNRTYPQICGLCQGTKNVPCSHEKTEQHEICIHDKVGQHDD